MTLYYQRTKTIVKEGLTVTLRYDDSCKNGHNTFTITAVVVDTKGRAVAHGTLHDEIEKACPDLAHLIKWHLCSDDGPIHYISNTLYYLGYATGPDSAWYKENEDVTPCLECAKSSAVWPDMPEFLICDRDVRMLKSTREAAAALAKCLLNERLPALLRAFHADVDSIVWDTTIPYILNR